MRDFLQDIRDLDRQAWLVIGMIGCGNTILLIAGLEGPPAYALIILAVLGFVWVLLLQFTRMIMWANLELAQEAHEGWHQEADLTQKLTEDYLATIRDLRRYDLQASGIHLERMRSMLIERHPELEDVIAEVEHPVNMPGISI